jgi:hypothetical protein
MPRTARVAAVAALLLLAALAPAGAQMDVNGGRNCKVQNRRGPCPREAGRGARPHAGSAARDGRPFTAHTPPHTHTQPPPPPQYYTYRDINAAMRERGITDAAAIQKAITSATFVNGWV